MVKNFKAGGELTIVDISDSRQLSSLISSTLQRQVIYDPNDKTYSPNYSVRNNVLVPQLFVTGNMDDIISQAKSVKWFYQINSIGNKIPIVANTDVYTLDTLTKELTIKQNVLETNMSMNYLVEIIYTDPDTKMDIITMSQIELIKISNGVNGIDGDNPKIAVLSNDSHSIPSDSEGLNTNLVGAMTELNIYEGIEDVTKEWTVTVVASTGVTGELRNLGTVTESDNKYDQSKAKNVYMNYGVEEESTENDWTSDYIAIEANKNYVYKQLYSNKLWYSASPYTTFTYYDSGMNYLFQEVKIEEEIAINANATFTYDIRTSDTKVRYIRTNGNLMYNGASFTERFSEGTVDSRVIYDVTGMTSDSGYVDFTARKNSETLKKRFTLTKVRRGATGSNAQLLYLSSTAETMTFNNSGIPAPALQTISITAKIQNITGVPTFTASPYNESGVKLADITLGGTGVTRTLTQAQWLNTYSRIVITATIGSLSDTITIVKLTAGTTGQDAIVGYLTNESVTLGASPTGVVGDFSASNGIFKVYDGLTDKTGSTDIVYAKVSNTGCVGSVTATGSYSVTEMSTDTATMVMSATYKTVVITKTLTLSKSKTGLAGESPTAYWITNSVGAIRRNDAGVYIPTSVTIGASSQKGITAPSSYAGRFIISETTNGTTWVDKYTSQANESTKTYTPSAGIMSLRVKLYMAGGTTTLIDEQTIPVITDGSDPIIAIVSTPLGSIIKNSSGNLTIEATLYKGGNIINATAYKWFKLDTSVSGGWRQLTSSVPDGTTGYGTKTLTVTPSAIASVSTFKVEAIYNGVTYTDMATVTDLSDPISVIIIGSGIYKNGQGTNSYTARLYQNGREIDVNGTAYLYKWNLLNKDGTLNTSFTATGKNISIPATAFDDTAQLKCDVDDRK